MTRNSFENKALSSLAETCNAEMEPTGEVTVR